MKKRFIILTAILAMAATTLSGCGSIDKNKVAITVGETEVTEDVVNFFARYTQAQYETYYASYFGDDMWNQTASEDKTYEVSTKESIVTNIENMVLLEQHMDEYKVEFTDAEKKVITDTATALVEANEGNVAKKASIAQDTAERALTLMAVESKMMDAVQSEADTEVSDEEAAQKAMSYVEFKLSETGDDGTTTELDDAAKAELKKEAKAFSEKAKKDPSKFAKYAEEAGYSPVDITFSADNTSYDEKLIEEGDKLKKNEVSGVIEGESYYVAVLTSEFDKDATEQQKESIVSERKNDLYQAKLESWKEDVKIKVDDKIWKNISFTDLSVTMKTEETEETTEAASEVEDAEDAAESAE